MANDFKDIAELIKHSDEQDCKIVKLQQELAEVKEKCLLLEKVNSNDGSLSKIEITNQEIICLKQLEHFKVIALSRELTLEEARKIEIYSKIMNGLKGKEEPIDTHSKKMSDSELLAIANELVGKNEA